MADQTAYRHAPTGPQTWPFQLWGSFAAPGDDAPRPRGRKARALLAYLLIEGRSVDRERLAALLWSERGQAQAFASLRQALLELRPLAGKDAPLLVGRQRIALDPRRVRADVETMEALAMSGDAAALAASLAGGSALCEDLDGLDPAFDEWLRGIRASRGEDLLAVARRCCRTALDAGASEAASQLARELQRIDPLDEAAARLAMEAAHAQGQREAICRTHDELARELRKELAVSPSPETIALHARLIATAPSSDTEPPAPPSQPADKIAAGRAPSRQLWSIALTAACVAALAGLALWHNAGPDLPTVAVASGGGEADELARNAAADLTRIASPRVGDLAIVDASANRIADYVVRIDAVRNATQLSARLTLIDRRREQLLWSTRLDSPPAHAADLREQLAVKLGDVLLCALHRDGHAPRLDPVTLRLFLTACEGRHEPGGDERQIALLRQVTARAPDFARGWAGLALAEAEVGSTASWGLDSKRRRTLRRAVRAHLMRARTLQPELGETYVAEALLAIDLGLRGEPLAILDNGIAAAPDFAQLHSERAMRLLHVGRMAEAVEAARRAVRLDPLSPGPRNALLSALAYSGRIAEAEQELSRAERIWPGTSNMVDARFRFDLRYGDPRNALRMLNDADNAFLADSLSEGHEATRLFLRARIDPSATNVAAILAISREQARRYGTTVSTACVQALSHFGQVDEAYRRLAADRRLEDISYGTEILFRPHLRAFRHDRRFIRLSARLGLLQYWRRSARWPDFCRDRDLPYDCRAEANRILAATTRN